MVGKKIGLAIGTNDYLDPALPNLFFAKKDAEDIRTVLLDPEIGGFNEVISFVDETKQNIKKGIEKLLLRDATFNDLVLIYFSGHGKLNSKFELNLVLKDTETDYLLSTALHYNFILDCIEESKCKKIIIILDCCHSGAVGIKGDISRILTETSGSGTFILCATTGSNVAKEVSELKNGIFTSFLLEGLRTGDADLGGDGLIDIFELYEYASKRCKYEYSQVTTIKTNFEERIVIGTKPLRIKGEETKLKRDKLVNKFQRELPFEIYNLSMNILFDAYEKSENLTEANEKICNCLDQFLENRISAKTYINTIQSYLENEDIENSYVLEKFKNSEIPKIFTSFSTGMELILIPPGAFIMGSSYNELYGINEDETPAHRVTIKKPFYMGKYPVTQKQWEEIMKYNPSRIKGEDLPVENVSWDSAQKFIAKLNKKEGTDNYRLPSEAEWEYACRAGTNTRCYFGNDIYDLWEYAWFDENSDEKTHPVGQKLPNPWGLYDMYGNVHEWVQDKWHENYEYAPIDGNAWEYGYSSIRVSRGGSSSSQMQNCCSADRWKSNHPWSVGFRLVRDV